MRASCRPVCRLRACALSLSCADVVMVGDAGGAAFLAFPRRVRAKKRAPRWAPLEGSREIPGLRARDLTPSGAAVLFVLVPVRVARSRQRGIADVVAVGDGADLVSEEACVGAEAIHAPTIGGAHGSTGTFASGPRLASRPRLVSVSGCASQDASTGAAGAHSPVPRPRSALGRRGGCAPSLRA